VNVGGAKSSRGAAATKAGRASHGIVPWEARRKRAARRIDSGKTLESGWTIHWDAPESVCSQYSMFTRSGAFAEYGGTTTAAKPASATVTTGIERHRRTRGRDDARKSLQSGATGVRSNAPQDLLENMLRANCGELTLGASDGFGASGLRTPYETKKVAASITAANKIWTLGPLGESKLPPRASC
jgi:hypothetical protein